MILGRMALPLLNSHRHLFGILDNVVLGDNVTVGVNDKTRARRSYRRFRHAEKSLQQLVKRRRRQTVVGALMPRAPDACRSFFASTRSAGFYDSRSLDYCGQHGLHDRGEAWKEHVVLGTALTGNRDPVAYSSPSRWRG